jgi:hypothetical protein
MALRLRIQKKLRIHLVSLVVDRFSPFRPATVTNATQELATHGKVERRARNLTSHRCTCGRPHQAERSHGTILRQQVAEAFCGEPQVARGSILQNG